MKRALLIAAVIIILVIAAAAAFVYYRDYYTYSGNAPAITEHELACGAYYGFYDQKKPGTPADWVWSDAGRSSSWSAPNRSVPAGLECMP